MIPNAAGLDLDGVAIELSRVQIALYLGQRWISRQISEINLLWKLVDNVVNWHGYQLLHAVSHFVLCLLRFFAVTD